MGRAVQQSPIETPPVVVPDPRPTPESVPPVRALIRSLGPNSHPRLPPPEPRPPQALNQVGARDPTFTRFSVLPTIVFPSIPPEPQVTLSLLTPERFQLSDAVQSELAMKLYV